MSSYEIIVNPPEQYVIEYSNQRGPQGPAGASLTVRELDGTPSVAATELVFANGALSVAGTVVTVASGGGGGTWGSITGTLSSQTDLQTVLDAKASTSAVAAGYQPLDSDLTDIAALTTTSTGRALLTESVAQTGTGGLVRATSPTLTTPNIGAATGTSLLLSGQATALTLMLGDSTGPLLRNNAGTIEVRNNANSAMANMSASQFTASFFRDSTNQANYFGAGINARNTWLIAYSSDGTDFGTKDLSFSRNAAGIGQLGNGTANASGSLLLTNLTASGTVRLGTFTVGTLPSAAANTRAIAYVTDSSVSTYGSVVVAGGSTQVMVLSNGTDWVVSGGGTSGLGSFTKAQLDTAVSDGNVLYVGDAPTAHVHAGSEITTGTVDPARLGSGSSITTKFLRGDSTWQSISGGGDALVANSLDQFADVTQTAGQTLSITSSTTLSGGTHSGTNTGDNAVNSLYSSLVSNATHTGDVTGDTALTIANGAVTLAKTTGIQKVITSGTAAPSGGADGDIYLQYT